MLTNRDEFMRGVPGRFRFRINLLARLGLVFGSIAALLFAFQANLHAQSSPLTVQPTTGNVGVGTTSPGATFHVRVSTALPVAKIEQTATTGGAALSIHQSGSATPREYRLTTSVNGHFKIADTTAAVDRVFLTSSGNMGIGVTDPATIANILMVQQNSATDPIADAWTTYSSRRWKTNIQAITGAVDKVERLRGVSFNWKADGNHDIGLIAEEVGEVVPEVVAYEDNGKDAKSVDYARLVAILIEAVKEQQAQITELKSEVEA